MTEQVIVTGVPCKTVRLHIAIALANMAVNAVSIVPTEPKAVWFPTGNTGKQKAQWKQETYGRKRK